jgi:hypothetical protein
MPTEKIVQQMPHQYFSPEDKACIRTLHRAYPTDWVTLPGPTDWWLDDYNFVKYGFVPKREAKEQIRGRLRALETVFADCVPAGLSAPSLSNEELMLRDPLPKHFAEAKDRVAAKGQQLD